MLNDVRSFPFFVTTRRVVTPFRRHLFALKPVCIAEGILLSVINTLGEGVSYPLMSFVKNLLIFF